ncbi:hypothetical protein ACXN5S_02225 [Pseudoroseicyclus sp. H15]
MRPLKRHLAAAAAALALAVPAPASAETDPEAVVKFLAGVAIVGIAAHALSQSDRDDEDDGPRVNLDRPGMPHFADRTPGFAPQAHEPTPRPFHPGPAPQANPGAAYLLPTSCIATYDTAQGVGRMMDGDCLSLRYDNFRRLPISCAKTVRTFGGFASGFDIPCLREEGYGFSAR